MRVWVVLAACAAAVTVACGGDAPEAMAPRFSQQAFTCGPSNVATMTRPFGCGGSISIHDATTLNLGAAITQAAAAWNAVVDRPHSGSNQVPLLESGGIGAQVQIVVDFGGGPEWCGATSVTNGQGTITLTARSVGSGHCNTNWSTDFAALLTHEFGHLLGFSGGMHKFGGTPADHCAHYLPNDNTINATVCQHEVEYLYAEYGERGDPSDDPTFWSTPIITRFDAPDSLTVPYAGSAQIPYGSFVFAYQPTFPPLQPMGSATVDWTSQSTDANVTSSGLVTNLAASSINTIVTGKIATFSGGYQLGLAAGTKGDVVAVHLNGAPGPVPPGPGFRISAINAPSVPFTTAGPEPLTAIVENGGSPVSVWWWVTYSDNATYNFFVITSSTALNLPVHAGSYNIQVTAQPVNGIIHGTEQIQNFPVCTGGGPEPLRSSGPEPDVKTGCTPP